VIRLPSEAWPSKLLFSPFIAYAAQLQLDGFREKQYQKEGEKKPGHE